MKAFSYILTCILLIYLQPTGATGVTKDDDRHYATINGTVKDKSTRNALAYATISVAGTTVSTVTNSDGEFTLKVKEPIDEVFIEISLVGYRNARIRLDENKTDLRTIWLVPSSFILNELIVYGYDPRKLVEEAIKRIPANYSAENNLLTGFYRETARKRKHYINIAEAVVHLYKSSYHKDAAKDRVQILKGRRLLSPKTSDTLSVKLLGGPTAAVYLDIGKNPDMLQSPDILACYDFHFEEMASIDDRPQYVVSFQPNRSLSFALYYGQFYIDRERLSFTRAEFSLDMSDRIKATQAILYKKPHGLRFRPLELTYQVNYVERGEKTYLSYVRNEIRFKCDWKRKLFSTNYTVVSEMVMTDIQKSDTTIPVKETFGRNQIFSDKAEFFFDPDFWEDYNIIKPTESLEHAVDRLKKQYREE